MRLSRSFRAAVPHIAYVSMRCGSKAITVPPLPCSVCASATATRPMWAPTSTAVACAGSVRAIARICCSLGSMGGRPVLSSASATPPCRLTTSRPYAVSSTVKLLMSPVMSACLERFVPELPLARREQGHGLGEVFLERRAGLVRLEGLLVVVDLEQHQLGLVLGVHQHVELPAAGLAARGFGVLDHLFHERIQVLGLDPDIDLQH